MFALDLCISCVFAFRFIAEDKIKFRFPLRKRLSHDKKWGENGMLFCKIRPFHSLHHVCLLVRFVHIIICVHL